VRHKLPEKRKEPVVALAMLAEAMKGLQSVGPAASVYFARTFNAPVAWEAPEHLENEQPEPEADQHARAHSRAEQPDEHGRAHSRADKLADALLQARRVHGCQVAVTEHQASVFWRPLCPLLCDRPVGKSFDDECPATSTRRRRAEAQSLADGRFLRGPRLQLRLRVTRRHRLAARSPALIPDIDRGVSFPLCSAGCMRRAHVYAHARAVPPATAATLSPPLPTCTCTCTFPCTTCTCTHMSMYMSHVHVYMYQTHGTCTCTRTCAC